MSLLLRFLFLVTLLVTTPTLVASQGVLGVQITPVYFGTGCPGGTVAFNYPDDTTSITTHFDPTYMQVLTAPGFPTTSTAANRFCEIALTLRYPRRYQFSITGAVYYYDVNLVRGTAAAANTVLVFPDEPTWLTFTDAVVQGPWRGSAVMATNVDPSQRLSSPCGPSGANATTTIRVQLRHRMASTDNRASASAVLESYQLDLRWAWDSDGSVCGR